MKKLLQNMKDALKNKKQALTMKAKQLAFIVAGFAVPGVALANNGAAMINAVGIWGRAIIALLVIGSGVWGLSMLIGGVGGLFSGQQGQQGQFRESAGKVAGGLAMVAIVSIAATFLSDFNLQTGAPSGGNAEIFGGGAGG